MGYAEGERVFGPPLGTYDADWVARAAVADGVPEERATELAVRAWVLLREGAGDRLADELGGDDDAHRVAAAATDFCRAYGVDVPR